MAINLIRYRHNADIHWGVAVAGGIAPLSGNYPTTADLIARGETDWRSAAKGVPGLLSQDVELLSPVTAPCRLLCQGANYRQHMIESGMNPDEKVFNMFFEKADCSVGPPLGSVTRPAHVALLDYEIELALVFRKAITGPVTITADNMHEYVFGITIANDVSARDVQIPQMQFFKGKSYRGFCPLGPHLAVLEREEFAYLDQLTLTLAVNGEVRQHDETTQSRLQAGGDDHRAVDVQRRLAGGRAADRHPVRMRAARSAAARAQGDAAGPARSGSSGRRSARCRPGGRST